VINCCPPQTSGIGKSLISPVLKILAFELFDFDKQLVPRNTEHLQLHLAETPADAIALLTQVFAANKQAFWASLHKQLDVGLNKQGQVHAGHLHHPVLGAGASWDGASSACTSPAPGFSCSCSRSGLIVLSCCLGSGWGACACPAFCPSLFSQRDQRCKKKVSWSFFRLGQTNIFDCFGWAEAPSYFYAYDDLA